MSPIPEQGPNSTIPPCGPERDRLVAEAVGWKWNEVWESAWDAAADEAYRPSESDYDALAALKAWKAGYQYRGVEVHLWNELVVLGVTVTLHDGHGARLSGDAPTLRDAATAALVRWRNEGSTK